MTELVITRGLPASGKTTYARDWVAKDRQNRARVNRDDIRQMADFGVYVHGATEQRVLAIRNASIKALLQRGVSVVCDDTNLPNRTVRDLVDMAVRCKAEWRIQNFTDVEPKVCRVRNALRNDKRPLDESVIDDMYMRYLHGRVLPLAFFETSAELQIQDLYVPDESLPLAFICDIDGTIALKGDRDPYDESRVHEDRPNMPVVNLVRTLIVAGNVPLFLSGRTAGCRAETWNWIHKHVIPMTMSGLQGLLFMRAVGDNRKDSIVKRELFDENVRSKFNVRFALDDRNQVVKMWRDELGLTCMQVAPGDF